ncbi:MAG: FAD-dependent oxidoreductase [Erysipelotrichaceae bacterium]|nr:FAD-dependent oxidoreductase [Erysipelotrichaceae bacterium]
MKRWRCTVCGYIHEGDEPPKNCPVCGVGSEMFELVIENAQVDAGQDEVTQEIIADILIVGGGAAGLGAACTALGEGASVIVLEKADRLGGTTIRSGGGYWVPCNTKQKESGWEDNKEDAIRYMARYSYSNQYNSEAERFGLTPHQFELIESYVNNAHNMADYLENIGALKSVMEINWTGKPQVDYMDHLPENKGIRGRTLYPMNEQGKLGMGVELIRQLEKYVKDKGGIVHTGYRVSEIIMEDGKAVGLVALANGKEHRFIAKKGIIFGSGGYSHDLELMTSLQRGPHYGGCSVSTNTGDFIKIAGSIGASIGNTAGAFRAQSLIDAYISNPEGSSSVFYIPGDSIILVNKYGKRVVDEKRNYTDRAMVHFVWDPVKAEWTNLLTFMVFDERTATLWQGFPPYPIQGTPLPNYLLKADSLPELAKAIEERMKQLAPHTGGFSLDDNFSDALLKTVEQFNSYAKLGVDLDFNRGENAYDREWTTFPPTIPNVEWPNKESKNYTMYPISENGPYYAIVLAVGTLDTNGGPVVNGNAQVLDWKGNVIPGLYGAGNCIASPTANAYWGAGSTIGPALTYGFIAVNHALSKE